MKFIKYMNGQDIAGKNIAMYDSDGRCVLIVEHRIGATALSSVTFSSAEDAQRWFDLIPSSGLKQLAIAMVEIVYKELVREFRSGGDRNENP